MSKGIKEIFLKLTISLGSPEKPRGEIDKEKEMADRWVIEDGL